MVRAVERDYAGKRVGTTGPQVPSMGSENKWYVNDMGRVYGPMSWNDIKGMAHRGQVTQYAQIWGENWPQWVPIWHYFPVKTQGDREAEALIPSRYDAMFYLGVFVFFIGLFSFFVVPVIGIPLFILSPIIEYYALYLEGKHKGRTVVGMLGNAIAIVWIVIQLIVTFFFIASLL